MRRFLFASLLAATAPLVPVTAHDAPPQTAAAPAAPATKEQLRKASGLGGMPK